MQHLFYVIVFVFVLFVCLFFIFIFFQYIKLILREAWFLKTFIGPTFPYSVILTTSEDLKKKKIKNKNVSWFQFNFSKFCMTIMICFEKENYENKLKFIFVFFVCLFFVLFCLFSRVIPWPLLHTRILPMTSHININDLSH